MSQKKCKTQYPGVRYREHQTRKTDNGTLDRYFFIRYRLHGKLKEEGVGWSSQGMNAKKASLQLAALQTASKTGEGAQSLAEKRQLLEAQKRAERLEKERQEREALTFQQIFEEKYYPDAKTCKTQRTYHRENQLFNLWIKAVVGDVILKDITLKHISKIKQNMFEAGRAPRSVNYALDVIRQVFNYAIGAGFFQGHHPIAKGLRISDRKLHNERTRFFTQDEADMLLKALKEKSEIVYEQALISVHCGLRASEIFALTWGDVNLAVREPFIRVKDSSKCLPRNVPMTKAVQALFCEKQFGGISELIYPARDGGQMEAISDTFDRVVTKLGLNAGVTDDRQKVVFHTCRHTYGSWMAQNGVPLYTIKELMGHHNIETTQRYAHLCNVNFQNAIRVFEEGLTIIPDGVDTGNHPLEAGGNSNP